jgi:hypothetical protein
MYISFPIYVGVPPIPEQNCLTWLSNYHSLMSIVPASTGAP